MPGLSPEKVQQNIAEAREASLINIMHTIVYNVEKLNKSDEKTLIILVQELLKTNMEQQELANLIGVSRASIARWSAGSSINRTPAFRAYMVERLLQLIRERFLDLPPERMGRK